MSFVWRSRRGARTFWPGQAVLPAVRLEPAASGKFREREFGNCRAPGGGIWNYCACNLLDEHRRAWRQTHVSHPAGSGNLRTRRGTSFWNYLSTKRAMAQARATPSLQEVKTQPIPDAFMQRIQSLPRPRRVRFRFPGAPPAIVVCGFAILACMLVFSTARGGSQPVRRMTAVSDFVSLARPCLLP